MNPRHDWLAEGITIALALCIPIGIYLAVHYDAPLWLFLCLPIFMFLT